MQNQPGSLLFTLSKDEDQIKLGKSEQSPFYKDWSADGTLVNIFNKLAVLKKQQVKKEEIKIIG